MIKVAPRYDKSEMSLFCPECYGGLTDKSAQKKTIGLIVICPRCSAISILDSRDGCRTLRTEEWWTLMTRAEYGNICEMRIQAIDEITAPPKRTSPS